MHAAILGALRLNSDRSERQRGGDRRIGGRRDGDAGHAASSVTKNLVGARRGFKLGEVASRRRVEGFNGMRRALILAGALATIANPALPAAAMEGDPPGFLEYDPVASCESVYAHNPNPAVMRVCIRNEDEFRDASLYLWSTLPSDLQTHCALVARVNARAAVQYQTLHACLSDTAAAQREEGGEFQRRL
jgi:hypothetical protein